MAIPIEQVLLVDSAGQRIDIEELVAELRSETQRVLADDDVGLTIYTGDLDIYELKPIASGECLAQRVTKINRPRFPAPVIRRQIGAAVVTLTADAVFVIRDGEQLRKVRAEDLEVGMVLASGEKVLQ